MKYSQFSSESVCAGHPDKICDQVSDAVLDADLKVDQKSRVAVETLVTTDKVVMAGEVTCTKNLDYENIARKVIKKLGYDKKELNFWDKSPVSVFIHQQSIDIALGVDKDGAGDQGMMFGYACQETQELMPLPIILAHRLAEGIDSLRETKLKYLRPDGKTEVVINYENGKPKSLEALVLAVPQDPKIEQKEILFDLYKFLVVPVLDKYGLKFPKNKLVLNGTGKWEIGGPASDTGVTGRKIVVDTYGGMARIGGGAFSGKDPSKVDRSGAYAARYVAKNIVAMGLSERLEIQVSYVIGKEDPLLVAWESFGTQKCTDLEMRMQILKLCSFRPKEIIEKLDLRKPQYEKTAAYGHFGRSGFSWEKLVQ